MEGIKKKKKITRGRERKPGEIIFLLLYLFTFGDLKRVLREFLMQFIRRRLARKIVQSNQRAC